MTCLSRPACRLRFQPRGGSSDPEEAIARTDLTEDVRAALWLHAFSMRVPRDRLRPARGHMHSVS